MNEPEIPWASIAIAASVLAAVAIGFHLFDRSGDGEPDPADDPVVAPDTDRHTPRLGSPVSGYSGNTIVRPSMREPKPEPEPEPARNTDVRPCWPNCLPRWTPYVLLDTRNTTGKFRSCQEIAQAYIRRSREMKREHGPIDTPKGKWYFNEYIAPLYKIAEDGGCPSDLLGPPLQN